MKLKLIILTVMAVITSFSVVAQNFQQPYPIGDSMKGNPNFIGTAYLYPLTEVKELNVPMFNSIIAGVGGVEPMAAAHMGICIRQGITPDQLSAALNIIETNIGPEYSEPLRPVVKNLEAEK